MSFFVHYGMQNVMTAYMGPIILTWCSGGRGHSCGGGCCGGGSGGGCRGNRYRWKRMNI